MSVHVLKRDLNRPGCPVWCTTDHEAFLETELREHSVTLASVPAAGGTRRATVNVSMCDDLDDGTRSMPAVFVWGADEGLSPSAARELALGVIEAARLVEQEAGPRERSTSDRAR